MLPKKISLKDKELVKKILQSNQVHLSNSVFRVTRRKDKFILLPERTTVMPSKEAYFCDVSIAVNGKEHSDSIEIYPKKLLVKILPFLFIGPLFLIISGKIETIVFAIFILIIVANFIREMKIALKTMEENLKSLEK